MFLAGLRGLAGAFFSRGTGQCGCNCTVVVLGWCHGTRHGEERRCLLGALGRWLRRRRDLVRSWFLCRCYGGCRDKGWQCLVGASGRLCCPSDLDSLYLVIAGCHLPGYLRWWRRRRFLHYHGEVGRRCRWGRRVVHVCGCTGRCCPLVLVVFCLVAPGSAPGATSWSSLAFGADFLMVSSGLRWRSWWHVCQRCSVGIRLAERWH